MRAIGYRILDDILDYVETLRERPVWQPAPQHVKAYFNGPPPLDLEPSNEMYQEHLQYIHPHQLDNSHPRFCDWVAGTGTVMGMFAEMLVTELLFLDASARSTSTTGNSISLSASSRSAAARGCTRWTTVSWTCTRPGRLPMRPPLSTPTIRRNSANGYTRSPSPSNRTAEVPSHPRGWSSARLRIRT